MAWARLRAAGLLLLLLALPAAALAGSAVNNELSGQTESFSGSIAYGPLVSRRDEGGPRLGAPAVVSPADTAAPLYAMPDADSAVLMEYYGGTRMTVLRDVSKEFYRVQIGEAGAGITGCIRKADVKIGLAAQREVQLGYMELQLDRDVEVYAYCDALSERLATARAGQTLYALSRSDSGWVQLCLPPVPHAAEAEDRPTSGFVYLEPGIARGYFRRPEGWAVEACQGEPELDQMIGIAIDFLEAQDKDIPDAFLDRASLEAMESRAYLFCRGPGAMAGGIEDFLWQVVFRDGEDVVSAQIRYRGGTVYVTASYIPPWGREDESSLIVVL